MALAACTHEPVYRLTVENGSGSGRYEAGTRVPVSANAAPGLQPVAWEGDTAYLTLSGPFGGEVVMPPADVYLRPYMLSEGEVSFRYAVFPVIQTNCNFDGCHLNSGKLTNFTGYAAVESAWSKIEQYLLIGFMPLNREISTANKQTILTWIAQGRKNN